MLCPACHAETALGDRFCGECGIRLGAPPVLLGSVSETLGTGLAAISDPGRVHPENQDAFRIVESTDGGALLVVCDGVSNSQTPADAAARAAACAIEVLQAGAGAMRSAIVAAHNAVCALPCDRQSDIDPPACTIVAACLERRADGVLVTLGWLGDSRAYVIDGDGARLLTHDHSWVNHVVDTGEMTLGTALRDRRAHALMACLGTTDFASATPCPEPALRSFVLRGPGWLLLCSDGLWNYTDTPAELQRAVGAWQEVEAAVLCQRLLTAALTAGGHDNVTIAAARLAAG
jgi:serine/threonine protein phosphatase PrpC